MTLAVFAHEQFCVFLLAISAVMVLGRPSLRSVALYLAAFRPLGRARFAVSARPGHDRSAGRTASYECPIEGEYQRDLKQQPAVALAHQEDGRHPRSTTVASPELRASDGGSGRMASPTSAKIGELDAHNSSGLCTSRGPRCMIGPQHASPSFSPTYQAYHSRQIATHERRGLAFIREGQTPALVRRACRKRANAIRRSF